MLRFKIASVVLCGCFLATSVQASVNYITSPPADGVTSPPYSLATVSGDFIYVTGNTGSGDDIGAQTSGTLDRIEATLKKAGADLSDVVQTQVYLADAADAAGMERAYGTRFSGNLPARTVVVTPSLVGGVKRIEINAIAVRRGVAHTAISPRGWQKPSAAFSYGQQVGNTLFISGLTAHNPVDGAAPPSDIRAQTRAVMNNVGAVLKAAGMEYENLVSGRVWIEEIVKNYDGMNDAYRGYFKRDLPARATLEFGMVAPADQVAISAVAVKGGTHKVVAASFDDAGKPREPNQNFSAGVATENRMWVTGMTGQTADNKNDVAAQTQLALERMLRVLNAGGFTKDQIVEVNCYLRDARDIEHFRLMNEGYRKVFTKDLPARTTLQGGNRGGSLVEITIMAAR